MSSDWGTRPTAQGVDETRSTYPNIVFAFRGGLVWPEALNHAVFVQLRGGGRPPNPAYGGHVLDATSIVPPLLAAFVGAVGDVTRRHAHGCKRGGRRLDTHAICAGCPHAGSTRSPLTLTTPGHRGRRRVWPEVDSIQPAFGDFATVPLLQQCRSAATHMPAKCRGSAAQAGPRRKPKRNDGKHPQVRADHNKFKLGRTRRIEDSKTRTRPWRATVGGDL